MIGAGAWCSSRTVLMQLKGIDRRSQGVNCLHLLFPLFFLLIAGRTSHFRTFSFPLPFPRAHHADNARTRVAFHSIRVVYADMMLTYFEV